MGVIVVQMTRHSFVVWLAALATVSLVIAADQSADPALEERVRQLIRNLGDKQFDTCYSARKELEAIGQTAVPLLPEVAKGSDERMEARAAGVIGRIERNQYFEKVAQEKEQALAQEKEVRRESGAMLT